MEHPWRPKNLLVAVLQSLWRRTQLPSLPPVSPAEWDAFSETVARHGLMGLLYASQPSDSQLSTGSLLALKNHYRGAFLANVLALEQLNVILRAFNRYGVPVVVLKGCSALLFLYDRIAWREIGDIDLLIQETHIDSARRIMTELGYISSSESLPEEESNNFLYGHLDPFCKEGHLPVGVHSWRFTGVAGTRGRRQRKCGESACGGSEGKAVRCICPSHFLIHAAVHSIKHFLQGSFPFTLKNLADVILVTQKFGEN